MTVSLLKLPDKPFYLRDRAVYLFLLFFLSFTVSIINLTITKTRLMSDIEYKPNCKSSSSVMYISASPPPGRVRRSKLLKDIGSSGDISKEATATVISAPPHS